MLSNRTQTQARESRKSRAAVPRRGVRWRPDLTDNQIVLPRTTRVHSANESFSQRSLCHDTSEGKWGLVGEPRDMKKTRPEALFTLSYASGRLLGQAS